jgi:Phage integrase, N-terminal SAM-like domain
VSVALDRRTSRWVVRWRQGGVHRSQSFTLKRDAEYFDREQKRAKQLGALFQPKRGAETLSEVVELWWAEHAIPTLQPLTRDGYIQIWSRHIRPALGQIEVRELTPGRVDAFRAELETAGVGRPTIAKALAILSGICRFAVIRGLMATNPVREVRKPSVRRTRFVVPAHPETVERVRADLLRRRRLQDATLVSCLHTPVFDRAKRSRCVGGMLEFGLCESSGQPRRAS